MSGESVVLSALMATMLLLVMNARVTSASKATASLSLQVIHQSAVKSISTVWLASR